MKIVTGIIFTTLSLIKISAMAQPLIDSAFLQEIIHIREELHSIPEYSHKEVKTSQYVERVLRESSPDYLYTNIGGHGIVAGYRGTIEGPSKMFRCELDAISTSAGLRHWCGHDGHMSILLGLSKIISTNREFAGTVWLLFQPAEEVGEGAALMVKDLDSMSISFDYSFALHNKPGVALNKVVLHEGVYAAASVGLELFFKGAPSHASRPELALSPYDAIFETAQYVRELNNNKELFSTFILGTIVNISIGEINYGVTPGEGYLRFTLRSFSDSDLEKLTQLVEQFAHTKAEQYSLEVTASYFDKFPATINHQEANSIVERALVSCGVEYEYALQPERGSDDYAFFAFNSTSAYFDIGNGADGEDLHQKGYQFSDEILAPSISIFKSIIYN